MKKTAGLFVRVENAGRSHMAGGFFHKYALANFRLYLSATFVGTPAVAIMFRKKFNEPA